MSSEVPDDARLYLEGLQKKLLSVMHALVSIALVLDNKSGTKSVVGNILAAVLTLLRCESISSDSFLYSRILRTCGPHADATAQKVFFWHVNFLMRLLSKCFF